MTGSETRRRAYRAGVDFSCPDCGRLWRDDLEHAEVRFGDCPQCSGDIRVVGVGGAMVEFAKWFKCADCAQLLMRRRGETVTTQPKAGFDKYA